jgi:hypothetical protein
VAEPKSDQLDAAKPYEWLLHWFDLAAGSVEVHEHDDHWGVWISNGIGGHSWGGTEIAQCRERGDARLVALALKTLRDTRREKATDHEQEE